MTIETFTARTAPAGAFTRVADAVALLHGWRRAALSLLLGAVTVTALPPLDFFPVLAVTFPLLVWLLDGAGRGRSAFFTGWWFGFGYHLAGLYWISNALLVDAGAFGWLIPIVCSGLPAVLAVFIGAATWSANRLSHSRVTRILFLAVTWIAFEWLRGHLLTGFPWNLIGYVWSGATPMLQVTALVGIHGLSLLTVLAAASGAMLAAPARTRLILPAIAWSLLLAAALWGTLRIADAPYTTVEGIRLRLVQANIPQQMKWEAAQRLAIFQKHLELSRRDAPTPPTHVIWPETAVPFFLADEPIALQAIAETLPGTSMLLTGSPRIDRSTPGQPRLWNSLLAVDSDGEVVATYDKFHLVPLGEYVPLRNWLNLAKITPGSIDFTAGPGPRTLRLGGVPAFSPLICYEVIFPGNVVGDERPAWLLNVTNDAWYGDSTGPYQHVQIARVRAVEEGLPMVRAANNGISVVVDAYGRVIARLGLGETGIIDADLPQALPATPYARYGDLLPLSLTAILLAITLIYGRRLRH